QVSGVIFSGGLYAQAAADHEHYVRLRERGLPVVLVNAAYDDLGFPRISVDDRSAVEQAFTHLRSLGHERIGMVLGPADHVPSARSDRQLTSVRQPVEARGRSAVATIMSQIGGAPVSSEELLFEPELVVRASTGPVASVTALRAASGQP